MSNLTKLIGSNNRFRYRTDDYFLLGPDTAPPPTPSTQWAKPHSVQVSQNETSLVPNISSSSFFPFYSDDPLLQPHPRYRRIKRVAVMGPGGGINARPSHRRTKLRVCRSLKQLLGCAAHQGDAAGRRPPVLVRSLANLKLTRPTHHLTTATQSQKTFKMCYFHICSVRITF